MQIELDASTAQELESQATAHGLTVTEYAEQVLSRYAAACIHRMNPSEPFSLETYEDAVAWILSQNPNIANQSHTKSDWQAIKSEGRSGRSNFDIDAYVQRMRAANPDYDTSNPDSIDWQAIKAEGRRY